MPIGTLVVSRLGPDTGAEVVVAINADREERRVNVPVSGKPRRWESLHGRCAPAAPTAGSDSVTGLGCAVCRAQAAE